jgi:hypothetical protein
VDTGIGAIGIAIVPREFKLELDLMPFHLPAADRAATAATSPAPHALGRSMGELSGLDCLTGFVPQYTLFVHLIGSGCSADVRFRVIQSIRRQTALFGLVSAVLGAAADTASAEPSAVGQAR